MATFAYHASHEQFLPTALLEWVVLAEKSGFDGVSCSDHFHPWSERQGQSAFTFAWLGAAMQATRLQFSTVCSPGQRYHPAIVAQAIGTLGVMFPGRFWIALGSGEALNEMITAEPWPEKAVRNQRLQESTAVIKRLLQGETVSHIGAVKVKNAKLYTRPTQPPFIIAAALTEETARWLGSWADGMVTINRPLPELEAIVQAFRNGGGTGKPVYLKVQLSYDVSDDDALAGAIDQWSCNVLPQEHLGCLATPDEFDAASNDVRETDIARMVHISSDLAQHVDWIRRYVELGFEKILLHNVNRQQERFIKDFGEQVLPALRR